MGHPVHHSICQLHANELPLRHLFAELDGVTSGPNSCTGPIGKLVKENVNEMDVVHFYKVGSPLQYVPDAVFKTLSADQLYLYRICQGIEAGKLTDDLVSACPGMLSHAR